MYTLINGSPKISNSNSMSFLKRISTNLDNYKIYELKKDDYKKILESIEASEVVVFAFPLYVDSPPSITLSFLDYFIDNKIKLKDKLIYIIINCGFKEGEQNITGINIIKNWIEKVKAIYASSILIGAGEVVGKEKYKFISKKALKKLKEFAYLVKQKQKSDDIITTMDLLNNKFYCYVANKSWYKNCKNNNLTYKDIIAK